MLPPAVRARARKRSGRRRAAAVGVAGGDVAVLRLEHGHLRPQVAEVVEGNRAGLVVAGLHPPLQRLGPGLHARVPLLTSIEEFSLADAA